MREQNLNDWYNRQSIYDSLSTTGAVLRDVVIFRSHSQEVVELHPGTDMPGLIILENIF
jgi:hypothetical protein